MSSESRPIDPELFARALEDLPVESLRLKVLELENSIEKLLESNELLRPFAEGTTAWPPEEQPQPDPECVRAIQENEGTVASMRKRIELLTAELRKRGHGWTASEEVEEEAKERGQAEQQQQQEAGGISSGGVSDGSLLGESMRNGATQAGFARNGEMQRNSQPPTANGAGARQGGSLDDEQIRRAMVERMRETTLGDEEDEGPGLHV